MLPKYHINKRKDMTSASEIVDKVLGQYSYKSGGSELEIVTSLWRDIVGEDIAIVARPVSLDGGVLKVSVKNGVWRQEISFMADRIKREINIKANSDVVNKVIFR